MCPPVVSVVIQEDQRTLSYNSGSYQISGGVSTPVSPRSLLSSQGVVDVPMLAVWTLCTWK
jgi:hypothetical protein